MLLISGPSNGMFASLAAFARLNALVSSWASPWQEEAEKQPYVSQA